MIIMRDMMRDHNERIYIRSSTIHGPRAHTVLASLSATYGYKIPTLAITELTPNDAVIPSLVVPSLGIGVMALVISAPKRFPLRSVLFLIYSISILVLTV